MIGEMIVLILIGVFGATFILFGHEKATGKARNLQTLLLILIGVIFVVLQIIFGLISPNSEFNDSSDISDCIIVYGFWFVYLVISYVIGYTTGKICKKYKYFEKENKERLGGK